MHEQEAQKGKHANEGTQYRGIPLTVEVPLEQTARGLTIPPHEQQVQPVYGFIATVNTAQNLWHNVARAAAIHAENPKEKLAKYGYLPPAYRVGPGRRRDEFPRLEGLSPALEQRYASTLFMVKPLIQILGEGFGEFDAPPWYIQGELTKALAPYALAVAEGAAPQDLPREDASVAARPQYAETGNERLRATAARLGISEEQLQNLSVQQFLGIHLLAEELLRFTAEAEAPTNLHPSHGPTLQERYLTTQCFAQAMTAVLEEGFQGQTVSKDFLQDTFDTGLAPYKMHVIDNPEKDPYFRDR
jgi:hypothetical protein